MSLTKKELVDRLAQANGLTKIAASGVLDSIGAIVAEELQQDSDLVLPGIGRFSVKERAARNGHNPQTGATIKIPATKVVKFSPAKVLREAAQAKPKKARRK